MTKEDKELLLKDICTRLPYGVMCECRAEGKIRPLFSIAPTQYYVITLDNAIDGTNGLRYSTLEEGRPYLRPMSSMTEEEYEEYAELRQDISDKLKDWKCANLIDWLNTHHFDYRGLIEKGLALEAPEGMYNTKEK